MSRCAAACGLVGLFLFLRALDLYALPAPPPLVSPPDTLPVSRLSPPGPLLVPLPLLRNPPFE